MDIRLEGWLWPVQFIQSQVCLIITRLERATVNIAYNLGQSQITNSQAWLIPLTKLLQPVVVYGKIGDLQQLKGVTPPQKVLKFYTIIFSLWTPEQTNLSLSLVNYQCKGDPNIRQPPPVWLQLQERLSQVTLAP